MGNTESRPASAAAAAANPRARHYYYNNHHKKRATATARARTAADQRMLLSPPPTTRPVVPQHAVLQAPAGWQNQAPFELISPASDISNPSQFRHRIRRGNNHNNNNRTNHPPPPQDVVVAAAAASAAAIPSLNHNHPPSSTQRTNRRHRRTSKVTTTTHPQQSLLQTYNPQQQRRRARSLPPPKAFYFDDAALKPVVVDDENDNDNTNPYSPPKPADIMNMPLEVRDDAHIDILRKQQQQQQQLHQQTERIQHAKNKWTQKARRKLSLLGSCGSYNSGDNNNNNDDRNKQQHPQQKQSKNATQQQQHMNKAIKKKKKKIKTKAAGPHYRFSDATSAKQQSSHEGLHRQDDENEETPLGWTVEHAAAKPMEGEQQPQPSHEPYLQLLQQATTSPPVVRLEKPSMTTTPSASSRSSASTLPEASLFTSMGSTSADDNISTPTNLSDTTQVQDKDQQPQQQYQVPEAMMTTTTTSTKNPTLESISNNKPFHPVWRETYVHEHVLALHSPDEYMNRLAVQQKNSSSHRGSATAGAVLNKEYNDDDDGQATASPVAALFDSTKKKKQHQPVLTVASLLPPVDMDDDQSDVSDALVAAATAVPKNATTAAAIEEHHNKPATAASDSYLPTKSSCISSSDKSPTTTASSSSSSSSPVDESTSSTLTSSRETATTVRRLTVAHASATTTTNTAPAVATRPFSMPGSRNSSSGGSSTHVSSSKTTLASSAQRSSVGSVSTATTVRRLAPPASIAAATASMIHSTSASSGMTTENKSNEEIMMTTSSEQQDQQQQQQYQRKVAMVARGSLESNNSRDDVTASTVKRRSMVQEHVQRQIDPILVGNIRGISSITESVTSSQRHSLSSGDTKNVFARGSLSSSDDDNKSNKRATSLSTEKSSSMNHAIVVKATTNRKSSTGSSSSSAVVTSGERTKAITTAKADDAAENAAEPLSPALKASGSRIARIRQQYQKELERLMTTTTTAAASTSTTIVAKPAIASASTMAIVPRVSFSKNALKESSTALSTVVEKDDIPTLPRVPVMAEKEDIPALPRVPIMTNVVTNNAQEKLYQRGCTSLADMTNDTSNMALHRRARSHSMGRASQRTTGTATSTRRRSSSIPPRSRRSSVSVPALLQLARADTEQATTSNAASAANPPRRMARKSTELPALLHMAGWKAPAPAKEQKQESRHAVVVQEQETAMTAVVDSSKEDGPDKNTRQVQPSAATTNHTNQALQKLEAKRSSRSRPSQESLIRASVTFNEDAIQNNKESTQKEEKKEENNARTTADMLKQTYALSESFWQNKLKSRKSNHTSTANDSEDDVRIESTAGPLDNRDYRHIAWGGKYETSPHRQSGPSFNKSLEMSPAASINSASTTGSVPVVADQALSNAAFLFSPSYADGNQRLLEAPRQSNDYPGSFEITTLDSRNRISSAVSSQPVTIPISSSGEKFDTASQQSSERRVRFSEANMVRTIENKDNKAGILSIVEPKMVEIPAIESKMSDLTDIISPVSECPIVAVPDRIDSIPEESVQISVVSSDDSAHVFKASEEDECVTSSVKQPNNSQWGYHPGMDNGVTPLRSGKCVSYATNSPYLRFQKARTMFSGNNNNVMNDETIDSAEKIPAAPIESTSDEPEMSSISIGNSVTIVEDQEETDESMSEASSLSGVMQWGYHPGMDSGVTPLCTGKSVGLATKSPFLRFKQARTMFSLDSYAHENSIKAKDIPVKKNASPIKKQKPMGSLVHRRIAAMQERVNEGEKTVVAGPYRKLRRDTTGHKALAPKKATLASSLLRKDDTVMSAHEVPSDTQVVDKSRTDYVDPEAKSKVVSAPKAGTGKVVSSKIASLVGKWDKNVSASAEIVNGSTSSDENSSPTSESDPFGEIVHPTTIDEDSEDLESHDAFKGMLNDYSAKRKTDDDEECSDSEADDDFDNLLRLSSHDSVDDETVSTIRQERPVLGAKFSSYRLSVGCTSASTAESTVATVRQIRKPFLQSTRQSQPISAIQRPRLPFREDAPVKPNEQNHRNAALTGALHLSPMHRTPMQARKWRALAAAAQERDSQRNLIHNGSSSKDIANNRARLSERHVNLVGR